MATKLGSKKKPAIVRVQTEKKAQEIFNICNENNWQVIVGIEPDKPEDTTDFDRLINPPKPAQADAKKRGQVCF